MSSEEENFGIEKKLKVLINDIDFDTLEEGLKNPNFFRILKISKAEIRHSNFLAWLFNPYESHNLQDAFLKRFLWDISVDLDLSSIENIEIRREWRNIDILIITEEIVVCIENKVDSTEHSDQLVRYKKIIQESFPHKKKIVFVYLTPYPNLNPPSDNEYKVYSYEQISDILEKRILKIFQSKLTPEVLRYLRDYIEILKLEIMQTHELNKIVNQIYNKHKEALDFIFDNKPDIATDFYKIFEKKVVDSGWITGSTNKGTIRFLTPKLKNILPQLRGNNQKEALIFEIDFYWMNQKTLCFKTVIPPGEKSAIDEEIRKVLSNCIERTENAKKPRGDQWLVHFIEKHPFKLEDMKDKKIEEMYADIEPFWIKITKIINDIEKIIFEDESRILELKNQQLLYLTEK